MDATLLSLPPAPLLELVCGAAQRQLTAVWLALANMLIIQLNPSSLSAPLRALPSQEVLVVVREVVSVLLQATLTTLSVEGAMEAVRQHPIESVRRAVEDDWRGCSESRYCARLLQFCGEGWSVFSFFTVIRTYAYRCPSISSQYFISSLDSLSMILFDVQYPLSACKNATPLSPHQLS